MPAMAILFGVGVAWLAYVYAGYPAILFLLGSTRKPSRPYEDHSPSVSVLISARNEEKDIEWKVRQTLHWSYPADRLQVLVASDASEDRTDEIVRGITDSRLRLIRMERRSGKIAALNHLAAIAEGEVLFFTDANTGISSQSLHNMIRHFADPQVGCVTGWERSTDQDTQTLSVAGRASLGYESSINALESKLGSVLICDGSIFCLRKRLYRQLDLELANDLELPLWVGHQGYKILYEPEARSREKATSSPAEEFQRRRRICAQGILGMWKLRGLLHGMRAWQFLSRKFLRWLTLIPLAMIGIACIALKANPYFQTVLAFQVVFYVLALIGCGLAISGRKGARAASLPFYFLLLNTAALLGAIEACFGRRFAVWDVPSLSRGHQQAT
jgi:cellulose synthase/poly-beta-1,6-N-acetylglucosamine synthase-like glycosyltransferase